MSKKSHLEQLLDTAKQFIWYQNEAKDREILALVASGDIESLEKYDFEYLRNLRFDSDGMATYSYYEEEGERPENDGWSLLNAAATSKNPEMIEFLVKQVGFDINQAFFLSPAIFCCLPSMHDKDDESNFSELRFENLKKFVEHGADLTVKAGISRVFVTQSASKIKNDILRQQVFEYLFEKNPEIFKQKDESGNGIFCYLITNYNFHYGNFEKAKPQFEFLMKNNIFPDENEFFTRIRGKEFNELAKLKEQIKSEKEEIPSQKTKPVENEIASPEIKQH